MKLLVAALSALLLCVITTPAQARTKKAKFSVDSLSIELKKKYQSKRYLKGKLKRVITGKLKKMRRCFVYVVKKNPKYDGYFWVSVTFSRRGRVTAKTITTTVSNNIASKCMEIMIDAWKLPRGAVGRAKAQVHIQAK